MPPPRALPALATRVRVGVCVIELAIEFVLRLGGSCFSSAGRNALVGGIVLRWKSLALGRCNLVFGVLLLCRSMNRSTVGGTGKAFSYIFLVFAVLRNFQRDWDMWINQGVSSAYLSWGVSSWCRICL